MRVLVCGGRTYGSQPGELDTLDAVLNEIHDSDSAGAITCLIHGAAPGADRRAGTWAFFRRVHVETYPARWESEGRAAGPLRNQRMLDCGHPDLVVAFPGGVGTADMVARAHLAGVPLRIVDPPMPKPPTTHACSEVRPGIETRTWCGVPIRITTYPLARTLYGRPCRVTRLRAELTCGRCARSDS